MPPPQVQRKLAAIPAADVAGYSRLIGVDEEGTINRLRSLRHDLIDPTIASRGGRIVNTTGDGLLIEFASVVDAVRCGLEVQRGMVSRNIEAPRDSRIEFRIGVHLGDVVIDGDDLLGDGVNIAARLEAIAQPGTICMSDDAYRQVRGRIDLPVRDLGEQRLKNIQEPVRGYAVVFGADTHPSATAGAPTSHAPRLSIVVLPFANLGGDAAQDYFVDGITESLTTDLSRIPGAFVIARNTAFTYKGKAIGVQQIGRELGVRYVLEGSVQRGGDRLRVNIQLIDAESGNHLWAERFDKRVADLFDMQDEIVARLANQLGPQFIVAEARRAERTPHPDAIDLYFQGMACTNRGLTPHYMAQAQSFFERALALDPDNIEALTALAYVEALSAVNYMSEDGDASLTTAEAALTRVLSLAPEHAAAHLTLGIVLSFTNRPAQGLAEFERALVLDRNLASAHGFMGAAKFFIGRAEETEGHVLEALR
ncbi:MAG TPA: adenylate/guanylate cyclase domain-containing protein, partial [Stellaceae bacterium]|nr:adenylate/guanylate cyclase domain-containing protein [Stellaceae bacterium]